MTTTTEMCLDKKYDESDEEIINSIDINGSIYDLPGIENFNVEELKIESIVFAAKAAELVKEYVKSETLRSSLHGMSDESSVDPGHFDSRNKTKKNSLFSSRFFHSRRKKKQRASGKINSCEIADLSVLSNSNEKIPSKSNNKDTDSQSSSKTKPLNSFFNRDWLNSLGDGIKKKASVMSELRKVFTQGNFFNSKKKVNITKNKKEQFETFETKKALKIAKTLQEDVDQIYDSDNNDGVVDEVYADDGECVHEEDEEELDRDQQKESVKTGKIKHKESLTNRVNAVKKHKVKVVKRNVNRIIGGKPDKKKMMKIDATADEDKIEEIYADELNFEKMYDSDEDIEEITDKETIEENEKLARKTFKIKGSLIKIGMARIQKTSMSVDKRPVQFFASEEVTLIECKKNTVDTVLVRNSLGRCGLIDRNQLMVHRPR